MSLFSNNDSNEFNKNKKDDIYNFWNEEIWEINFKLINNKDINKIFYELDKYKKELNDDKTKFNIDDNYEIIITNNKKIIKKKIITYKKNNLNFLKNHADIFLEFHIKIHKYFEFNNLLWKPSIKPEINILNKYIIDINNINEHLNLFSDCISDYKKINDYDIYQKNIIKYLSKNLNTFSKKILNFLEQNINNEKIILIIDIENILKSFKIQDILKKILSKNDFDEYFTIWENGYFQENDNDIDYLNTSISQYSYKINYIEPFSSLLLNIEIKLKIVKILINTFLNDYNTINVISFSKLKNNLEKDIEINVEDVNTEYIDNNNLFLSIYYEKNQIREQDDHLLIFIYTLLKKYNYNVELISSDKFKWYTNKLETKNFKFIYDFDKLTKELIIDNSFTYDIYKFNDKYLMFPNINFHIIEDKHILNIFVEKDYDVIINILKSYKLNKSITSIIDIEIEHIYKFLLFYYVNDNINSLIDIYNIVDFIIYYSNIIKNIFSIIFDFLNNLSKKEIFKLSLKTENKKIGGLSINILILILEKYNFIIYLYQILKIIGYKFYLKENKFINKLINIFSNIIFIYDSIENNIYKIRKLSISKSNLKELFAKLNISYIYIKKNGFIKSSQI